MIGSILNSRYRLDSLVGEGGMGVVYRAHDMLLERDVAIKVLNSARLGPEGRARLQREARAAAQLNHPNIVSVYDAGEGDLPAPGHPDATNVSFIVMELVEGESLHHRRPQTLDEILATARQICAALEHAHNHGIIHRDLKPENVLVMPDGIIKLMDFGMARSGVSRQTVEGTLAGTVFYIAPEQALGSPVDARTDLYSLGVLLYELVTGRLPFIADDPLSVVAQHIHAPVEPPSRLKEDIPPVVEAVILRLLSKDPAGRYASARQVAQALEGLGEPGQITPRGVTPNNLPVQLSSFIGREQEIQEVKRLLFASRLVTLTGAGGSGKTRLALQLAAGLLAEFPDGVWLVELGPISDPALVPQTVISALGVHEQPGRPPMETLAEYLHTRRVLLILDNCEHLIDACAQFSEALLRTCIELKILATSREAIGITGENAWYVPTLSVPDPQSLLMQNSSLTGSPQGLSSALKNYEAVQLFLDRAKAVQPTFNLTDQNAMAVAQICYQLDGIPLAIELAAARMKALSVEQVAARLDDRFNLLTVGSRTALPRQQTLRATIDWSYELLPQAERTLLSRLSVFANGWTLDAAEAICTGSGIEKSQVLDLLTRLVDKSLVVKEEQAREARYFLLETIRQYAREKLHASGEAQAIQDRHLLFFQELAEEAEPHLRNLQQIEWLDRLEADHDNLRAALDWSLEMDDPDIGLLLAGELARFWYLRGYWREGQQWLKRTLARDRCSSLEGDGPLTDSQLQRAAMARGKALYGAGWLQNESGQEIPLYREALELSRRAGDAWGEAFSLRGLGSAETVDNDFEQAAALLQESLTIFKRLGDPWGIALAQFNLGWVASNQDEVQSAGELWQECLNLFRQSGDRWGIAVTLGALSYIARLHNDYLRASQLSRESLALFQELGDKAGIAQSLSRLGSVAFRRDDFRQAAAFYEESLVLLKELGYTSEAAFSVSVQGLIACYQGDYPRATRLLEESKAVWQELGYQWGIAWALEILGLAAYYQAEMDRAAQLWEESLRHYQEIPDKSGMASTLNGLGLLAYRRGDDTQALAQMEQGLVYCREVSDKRNLATSLISLGKVNQARGERTRAMGMVRESLVLRQEIGAKRGIAESLETLGSISVEGGEVGRAARLFGSAEALREAIGAPLPPVERPEYERSLAVLQAALSPDAYNAALAEGRAMARKGWEQAVEYALQEGSP